VTKVVVFGTGDFAEVAVERLRREGGHEVVALAVERSHRREPTAFGLPVLAFEDLESAHPPANASLFIAVGPSSVNRVRARLFGAAKARGYHLLTHVSPRATVGPDVRIGENCFVFEGCIVETGASIGDDTILWSGAYVAHHSSIGRHCFLAPYAAVSGRSVVEDGCFLGIHSTVRDHVRVGRECVIGAGAVVRKDVAPGGVYAAPEAVRLHDDSSQVRL